MRSNSKHYGLILGKSKFREMVLRYQTHRHQENQSKLKNTHYSKDFILTVVNEHIIKGIPIKHLARLYYIPSHATVRIWILKYTREEEMRNYAPKPVAYTMKDKKRLKSIKFLQ